MYKLYVCTMFYTMCNVGIMIQKFHVKNKFQNTRISEKKQTFSSTLFKIREHTHAQCVHSVNQRYIENVVISCLM